jgi:hypothetical protein
LSAHGLSARLQVRSRLSESVRAVPQSGETADPTHFGTWSGASTSIFGTPGSRSVSGGMSGRGTSAERRLVSESGREGEQADTLGRRL